MGMSSLTSRWRRRRCGSRWCRSLTLEGSPLCSLRIVMMKGMEKCYIASSCPPPALLADTSVRTAKRLDVMLFVAALVMAMSLSAVLRGLGDEAAPLRSATSYYGDNIAEGEVFEYVVVGSGAAGSAAAARLARAGHSTLLLEVGGDPQLLTQMPGAAVALPGSAMDWNYDTVPNNKSCLGQQGRRCRLSFGRCLGGSSSINFMMYTRGNRQDYDFNITGWTWNDIEPYFLRYEGLRDLHRLPKSSKCYHNTTGIIPISYFGDFEIPWHSRLIEGLKLLNFPYNPDVNAESQIGVSRVLGFTSDGERISISRAYLEQNFIKRKLKVAKNTRCTGIIIDNDNIAKGVTVSRGDDTLRLYAKKEVILSAGAISTAQLLMLSGVGPQEHLQHLGIPVKSNLPVGEEMFDHVAPLIFIKIDHDARSLWNPLSITSKSVQALNWLISRRGPLATIGLTDVTAFANTRCYNYTLRQLIHDRPECEIPTLQLINFYMDKGAFDLAKSIIEKHVDFTDEISNQLLIGNSENAYLVISPIVLHPESRGSMQLKSADPLAVPAISPNYLDDERDVQEMVRALRMLEQLTETPLFRKYNASIHKFRFSECPEIESNGYWECYARQMSHSAHHTMGTAALGKVVDERLRVKGIKNLRVADASVFPRPLRGNTAAAVIAIGERLSDFIIEDRRMYLRK